MVMETSRFESFLKTLYLTLVGKDEIDNNIVRKHTRKVEELGEVSFPTEINSWHHMLDVKKECATIFEYSHETTSAGELVEKSKAWPLIIDKYILISDKCHLFLNRQHAVRQQVREVLQARKTYGSYRSGLSVSLRVDVNDRERTALNLSDLRLLIARKVTDNFLSFVGNDEDGSNDVLITNKSSKCEENKCVIMCGAVLTTQGSKDTVTTAGQFYGQREVDMRMMAEHKYGLRVVSKPGWREFFVKLGDAAVTIELLQNKLGHTTTIDINDHYIKNASFILYNCARLATLFKQFDKKVKDKEYPELPQLDEINFELLTQPEEWELFYVYVLQFPLVIKSCIKDITQGRINVHYLISTLSSMTSLFSIYYRRVRILTDPRPHLFPVLFARIYLLQAVQWVLHNGLHLLGIEPVKQM